uniref:PEPCK_GTP domain-containing protein n=1 Tax=Anisakis simplex TaxID=6269 RepID=A0A0M3IYK7_ANISI
LKIGKDGRLYALNPLKGFYQHVKGFTPVKNSTGKEFLTKDTIFTNVGYTSNGQPIWNSSDSNRVQGEVSYDWNGQPLNDNAQSNLQHPQASAAVRCSDCPAMHSKWDSDEGVPLSAIVFCTRRRAGVPLIFESFGWQQAVFHASTLRFDCKCDGKGDETRFDPMGMTRYIGYPLGEYIQHWLSFDKTAKKDPSSSQLPKVFFLNLFKENAENKFLWPGFGENIRILQWIVHRISKPAEDTATKTFLGYVPRLNSINLTGIKVDWDDLVATPKPFWVNELRIVRKTLDAIIGNSDFPKAISDEFFEFGKRLSST